MVTFNKKNIRIWAITFGVTFFLLFIAQLFNFLLPQFQITNNEAINFLYFLLLLLPGSVTYYSLFFVVLWVFSKEARSTLISYYDMVKVEWYIFAIISLLFFCYFYYVLPEIDVIWGSFIDNTYQRPGKFYLQTTIWYTVSFFLGYFVFSAYGYLHGKGIDLFNSKIYPFFIVLLILFIKAFIANNPDYGWFFVGLGVIVLIVIIFWMKNSISSLKEFDFLNLTSIGYEDIYFPNKKSFFIKDKYGRNTLFLSVVLNDVSMAKLLIKNGVNINEPDFTGKTVLICSIERSTEDVMDCLLQEGADIHQKDNNGMTALHYAAKENDINLVNRFIKLGADKNMPDKDGNNPLHHAVLANAIDVVKLLIDKKADLNCKSIYGKTPLDYAIWFKRQKIKELLVNQGTK